VAGSVGSWLHSWQRGTPWDAHCRRRRWWGGGGGSGGWAAWCACCTRTGPRGGKDTQKPDHSDWTDIAQGHAGPAARGVSGPAALSVSGPGAAARGSFAARYSPKWRYHGSISRRWRRALIGIRGGGNNKGLEVPRVRAMMRAECLWKWPRGRIGRSRHCKRLRGHRRGRRKTPGQLPRRKLPMSGDSLKTDGEMKRPSIQSGPRQTDRLTVDTKHNPPLRQGRVDTFFWC
jgi:hypothetical protein